MATFNSSSTCVLINQGIIAYSAPYNPLVETLLESHYDIFGMDLRGHGLSDEIRVIILVKKL